MTEPSKVEHNAAVESQEGAPAVFLAESRAEETAWNRYVESHPRASLGHLFEWKRILSEGYGKRCYFLAARRDAEWEGVLPLAHMRGPFAGNRLVSLPFLDQAGILASSAAAREALEREAIRLVGRVGARGFDLRDRVDETAATAPSDRVTMVLPLLETPDALWKSFTPKVRNQVRKSEKEGLTTAVASPPELRGFYRVFARNMRDLGSPVHRRRFFELIFDALPERTKLFVTTARGGEPIGYAIAIRLQNTVTVPWASSLRAHFKSCPNHSLYWRILGDSVESGAELFDFGRSYRDSGTYRFKKQWGAQECPLLWRAFDEAGREAASSQLKPSEHQNFTRIWSRLPLPVANLLGPMLRQWIPN